MGSPLSSEPARWNDLLLSNARETALLRQEERALSRARGLIYQDGRVIRVIDLQLRPRLMSRAQVGHLARLADTLARVQRRVAEGWPSSPVLQRVLPLSAPEEEFFRKAALPQAFRAPVISRLDASLAPARSRWKEDLRLFELNSVGVGGLLLIPIGERVVEDLCAPRLGVKTARPCGDTREALLRLFRKRARELGVRAPTIGLVEDRREPGGTAEYDWLKPLFRAQGMRTVLADLRQLSLERGRILLAGEPVDLLYRDTEVKDLFALKGAAPAREAFQVGLSRGAVISGLAGDFDHKSLWEVATDERLAGVWLEPGERRLLTPHILWTRLLFPRRTRDERGRSVDLERAIREGRTRYVIKPNREYGGHGVTIGADCTAAGWDRALEKAFARPGTWVAQALGEVLREEFPVVKAGRVSLQEMWVDCGLFRVGDSHGILSRASPRRVVNVASGGGLAAVFVTG